MCSIACWSPASPLVPKPIVGRVASRYVAGESLADAVRVVRTLNQQGAMATVDVLGEEVSERAKATAAVEEYLRVFETIDREKIDSNVSIKLTLLGLKIDEGFCRDNVARIVETAKRFGNFVRIDMEDNTTTDATLRIYRELHARYGNLGVVLQAYMRRTLRDIEELPAEGASVRLCKGIYVEPREIAWKGYETVRHNYVQALDKLFSRGVYVGIATHDEFLACAATRADRPPRAEAATSTSSRCSSGWTRSCAASSSPPATGCASTSPTAATGIPTRSAACARTPRSPATS